MMLVSVAKVFFEILEFMFFAGIIGSALVVILTSIEDAKELRDVKEEQPPVRHELRPEGVS